MNEIDTVVLNFDSGGLFLLNVILAFIMFGIALDLKWSNFQLVFRTPRMLIIGLTSQLIVLPFMTYLLIELVNPLPSMALGMILVASCPGGNISNFMSALARANVELSIVMTFISSMAALFFTPLNLSVYGQLYGPANEILRTVELDWLQIVKTIALIIVIPIIAGKLFSHYWPKLAQKLKRPLRNLSMLAFLLIVIFALLANGHFFLEYIGAVFLLVLAHNGLAFLIGYRLSKGFRLERSAVKSITIETGIQNSGLGLLLIFAFFSGLGGMAVVASWWGIWHIISGFAVAWFFKDR